TGLLQNGIYIGCNRPNVVALTFDDGPYIYSWDLAKQLHDAGVKATFFINGINWVDVQTGTTSTSDGEKTYMEVIKHYHSLGHEIGSHTYQHKPLIGLSEEEVRYQMDTQSDIIYKAIGKRPALMRPPTGQVDDSALSTLNELGYSIVNWNLDTRDWESHSIGVEKSNYLLTLDNGSSNTNGFIALQHEVFEQTVEELVPWVIEYVKSKKFSFVTTSSCIGRPAYH
ncbi:hypothetical protein BDB01DRAFT_720717, partial [Pilobolus umbonatus]